MRRLVTLFLFAMLALGVGSAAMRVSAQDESTESLAGHALIGAWILNDPSGTPSILAFSSDGIVTDAEFDGGSGIGVWEATGEQTAAATVVIPVSSPEFTATIQVNGTFEVDASGDAATGTYTFTVVAADGTIVFAGDGEPVTLTRMTVQPLTAKGTPMPGVPIWNPNQEEGEPEPEASPSA